MRISIDEIKDMKINKLPSPEVPVKLSKYAPETVMEIVT